MWEKINNYIFLKINACKKVGKLKWYTILDSKSSHTHATKTNQEYHARRNIKHRDVPSADLSEYTGPGAGPGCIVGGGKLGGA